MYGLIDPFWGTLATAGLVFLAAVLTNHQINKPIRKRQEVQDKVLTDQNTVLSKISTDTQELQVNGGMSARDTMNRMEANIVKMRYSIDMILDRVHIMDRRHVVMEDRQLTIESHVEENGKMLQALTGRMDDQDQLITDLGATLTSDDQGGLQ